MTYSQKTTENLRRLAALSDERNGITPDMSTEHSVFRGLRDMNGNGVVTGLTEISTSRQGESTGRNRSFMSRRALLPRI